MARLKLAKPWWRRDITRRPIFDDQCSARRRKCEDSPPPFSKDAKSYRKQQKKSKRVKRALYFASKKPETFRFYRLSSSWTKFRREWSTRGRFRAKIRALRREPATRPSSIDKCASVLDEESRAYLQYVVTVPRTDSTKIQAFVIKVGEKIGQLRLIWQKN